MCQLLVNLVQKSPLKTVSALNSMKKQTLWQRIIRFNDYLGHFNINHA